MLTPSCNQCLTTEETLKQEYHVSLGSCKEAFILPNAALIHTQYSTVVDRKLPYFIINAYMLDVSSNWGINVENR